jgi:hypothetical protein
MEELFTKQHFIEVLEALHRDQTGLANALADVKRLAQSWTWAVESRGSYEWDDDEYQKEFGRCLDAIIQKCDNAMHQTSKAHQVCCGKYGHVHTLPNEPVQRMLPFMKENYEDFANRLMMAATVFGA